MLSCLMVLVACAPAGGANDSPLPWLHGFATTAATDTIAPAAAQRLAELAGDRDGDGYGGLALATDDATVLASFQRGVVVVDRAGRVIARAPGFAAEGSADELRAIATGDAMIGAPVIALAINIGGHRESTTSLVLYRARGRELHQVFAGAVEEHEGADTWSGSVVVFPGGLVYRAPRDDAARLWLYDARRDRYVESAPPPAPDRPRDASAPVI
jgi:hypothetical protein